MLAGNSLKSFSDASSQKTMTLVKISYSLLDVCYDKISSTFREIEGEQSCELFFLMEKSSFQFYIGTFSGM